MADVQIYALQCPKCGAKLEVAKSLDVFACGYCGATVKLAHSGGTVALELLAGHLAGVQRGTDKTAAELALRRLAESHAALRREKEELSDLRLVKRTEFLIARSKFNTTKSQVGSFAVGAVILCIVAILSSSTFAGYALSALAILAIGATTFFIYRGTNRLIKSTDSKERDLLASFADQENKLSAQMESTTKRMAEAQKIADA